MNQTMRTQRSIAHEPEEPLSFKNPEGYADPTSFFALRNVMRETRQRKKQEPRKRKHVVQVIHYE